MTTENQSLNLEPLILPNQPDWFPLAWGWWAFLAGIIIAVLGLALFFKWRTKRLRAKKNCFKITHSFGSSAYALFRYGNFTSGGFKLLSSYRDRSADWFRMVRVS
ncbi:hypothetical protein ACOMICROBIO_FLGHMIGD_03651 [Vibrio sp. B1FLJ16]|nr:hypothetical protein ACOMICROBIO_FLGHMIGD_03651 [Vibrio sp. B1FLJ16]CAE6934077.1 hypothetical protein ACOMICROBIO_FLGHMIGD_03651 [Vibrio sp. B1FLJ16]